MNQSTSADPDQMMVLSKTAWHALAWLVFANIVGVVLAVLLLVPSLNALLGEWTYGRWVIVHMNVELYGWTSLPLIGYLFHVYGVARKPIAPWCSPVLSVWSSALIVGSLSWLNGNSTGRLFLDWTGYAQTVFVAALLLLWLLLFCAFLVNRKAKEPAAIFKRVARVVGLVALLAVPFVFLAAANPSTYPPIDPSTGGPTGASQLESTLAVVLLLLLLPLGIARMHAAKRSVVIAAWSILAAHAIFCAALGRADVSHRLPLQYLGVAGILIWFLVVPAYYRAFQWQPEARRWRIAMLVWWAALVVTGVILFLPGVLDRFKFTDGLVGHSFVAMAGFASSFIILVMVQLLKEGAWVFNRPRSFYLWHGAVAAYVVVVTIAGWKEGSDPAFTIVPHLARNALYALRLLTGVLMLLASIDWLIDCTTWIGRLKAASAIRTLEITA